MYFKKSKTTFLSTLILSIVLVGGYMTLVPKIKEQRLTMPAAQSEQLYNSNKTTEKDSKYREIKSKEDYKNLKYNKKDLGQAYLDAKKYCNTKIMETDENGVYLYAGTGCYEGCISEFLTNRNSEYQKIFDIIWDYCSTVKTDSEGMTGTRNCLISEFEQMLKN